MGICREVWQGDLMNRARKVATAAFMAIGICAFTRSAWSVKQPLLEPLVSRVILSTGTKTTTFTRRRVLEEFGLRFRKQSRSARKAMVAAKESQKEERKEESRLL